MALTATERYRLNFVLLVLIQDFSNALFQTEQANEFGVCRVGNEMHLGWRRLGWGNLKRKSNDRVGTSYERS